MLPLKGGAVCQALPLSDNRCKLLADLTRGPLLTAARCAIFVCGTITVLCMAELLARSWAAAKFAHQRHFSAKRAPRLFPSPLMLEAATAGC